ncbi:MAG: cyclodeaminase/cyclohydrolase family protein [Thermodesulfobacteriota bacterium]
MTTSFLSDLAQPRPDPGGGAAAAYGATLALALLEKVIQLELRRPHHEASGRLFWERQLIKARELTASLSQLQEADVRAYARLAAARASQVEGGPWSEIVQTAIDCPLSIMAQAREAMTLVSSTGVSCQRHLVSDLLVALEFLGGAIKGAAHIALANLPLLNPETGRKEFSARISRAFQQGKEALRLVRDRLTLVGNSPPGAP